MSRFSIKLRVTLWYTLVMIVISSAALFVMTTVSHRIIERESAQRVIVTVNDMARHLVEPDGSIRIIQGFRFFDRGVHIGVYNDNHELVMGMIPFEFADSIGFEDDSLKEKSYAGERYIYYVKRMKISEIDSLWVVGVLSAENQVHILNSVGKTNILLMIILIVAAAIGGYMIMRHALMPVDRISRTAKEISESGDLSQRICPGDGKDEIYRLAYTFDEMLDKIEKTLQSEKQFTSDASHELRTPVAVITSECEYVLDCAATLDEAKDSVASIKRQSDKMSKLISGLLTMSRMDKNIQQTNFEDVDISELLSIVCDEQEEIHNDEITLIRKIDPKVHATADQFLLTRLFINLISNAYQYGRKNGKITVSLTVDESTVTVSVEDDGIGIAKDDISKIWERFYQVDPSRTNEGGSAGLGLSMVKWIAECHGGKISVDSEPGQGSVFTFTFPMNRFGL